MFYNHLNYAGNYMMLNILANVFVIITLCCHTSSGLELSDYQTASFKNTRPSSVFNHFVSYNQTVYIGAIDAIYQLGENFARQEIVNTEMVECEDGSTTCPNYNKILLVDEATSTLITCESIDGFCATRSLDDIKLVIHVSSGLVVSPGTLTTEAIIAPGPLNGYADLYVAATYDFTRHSQDVYPVTRRTLNSLESVVFSIEGDAIVRITKHATTIVNFIVNYIRSFTDGEFSYFVQSQLDDFAHPILNYSFVSKISRVCHNNGNLETYSQILTQCQGTKGDYNLVQAAYLGPAGEELAASLDLNSTDKVLYGVFAMNQESNEDKPSNQSALCIYKLDDIKMAFIDAVFGCLTGGKIYDMDYVEGGTVGCHEFPNIEEAFAEQVKCIPTNWRYADGIEPLISTAVLEWSDTLPSSIITTTHRNHTVAFVGTAHGHMAKVHIHNSTYAREYERFSVGSPVLRDVEIDQYGEQITILTEQQLIKMQVQKCSGFTSCTDCIGSNGDRDGDPYCGWCTLENRCTRYDECPLPDVSTRWLPYNSAQCVAVINIIPNDRYPIAITDQQITLTVEQLPELIDGYSYQCVFDDNPPMPASKSGNELTCQTPVASRIPSIPFGEDHVTMQLYVYSTETQVKFVQRDFYFYECNTHKMCVACTSSSWACDWCIYSNKCTHDNNMCTEDDSTSIISGVNNPATTSQHGPTQCPQLVDQDDQILISDDLSTTIMVTGENLPDPSKANNYRCILEIEGREVTSEATRDGNDFTCKAAKYNYADDVAQLDVSLSVLWNSNRKLDDVYGYTVTLYKCAVRRPDCSRCLSSITTAPELNCGWCSMDDVCTVQGGTKCTGGWMPANTNQNCPNPVLIQVFPPSGTLNGNTVITISGTDLGRQFSDITSVKVGNKDCSTDGLEQDYKVGSSILCKTMSGTNNAMETITVTVTGNDGNSQQSTGDVIFTYRNPSISSIDPQEGPEAGGTIVTITGQYLDACSELSATIGSECIMNRMDDVLNSTTARCRTTSSPVDSSHKLIVTFDEVTDKEPQDEFTYRPNPTVEDVQPRTTIESGGIALTVTGTGFNLAQTPQMIMFVAAETFTEDCTITDDTMMLCKTPNTKTSSDSISRRKRQVDPLGEAGFGFIIADVSDLLRWSEDNNVTIEYFPDPEYFPFEENPKPTQGGSIEQIQGRNLDAGSSASDVTVYIGTEPAIISTLGKSALIFTLPIDDPGPRCINGNTTKGTCVVVYHGNVPPVYIGTYRYPKAGSSILIIIVGVCIIGVLVLVLLLIAGLYVIQSKRFKKERDALILERLLLLQKRVEDVRNEIESLHTRRRNVQPTIVLPNNVQINAEDVKIRYNELTMERLLGHGAFGEVHLATLRDDSGTSQVAVKSIQGAKDPSTVVKFLEEGLIMKDFDHPNVLGLIGLTFDPEGSPLVVLPLMKNGDLKSFMKKTTLEIRLIQKLNFGLDAAKGMAYLAGKKFVHRDLAARNCMVDADLLVKIGDFGRSRDLEDDYDYTSRDKKAKLPVKWMAPESLGQRLYNEKTDVWSFGVLMWEIFTNGAKPYKRIANKDMYYYITGGNILPCPENCAEDVYNIMKQCWSINPKDRCRFRELVQKLVSIISLLKQAVPDGSSVQNLPEAVAGIPNHTSYLELIEEAGDIGDQQSMENPREGAVVGDTGDRQIVENHDSYLHPMEGAVASRDSYLHPMEEDNKAFAMEMTNLHL